MNKPTPTTHGAWRMVDGQLVDESQQVQGIEVEPVSIEPVSIEPVADPAIEPLPPAAPAPTPRRKRASKAH